VHELGCDQPKTTKELLDVTTRHAFGEEAVWAVFMQGSGKVNLGSDQGAPSKAADNGAKKGARSDKRGLKQRPQWVTVAMKVITIRMPTTPMRSSLVLSSMILKHQAR
jgi:hypothetical protein